MRCHAPALTLESRFPRAIPHTLRLPGLAVLFWLLGCGAGTLDGGLEATEDGGASPDGNLVADAGDAAAEQANPHIAGTLAAEGDRLFCVSAEPDPAGSFRWFRNGEPIAAETADHVVVTAQDDGALLRCEIIRGTGAAVVSRAVAVDLSLPTSYVGSMEELRAASTDADDEYRVIVPSSSLISAAGVPIVIGGQSQHAARGTTTAGNPSPDPKVFVGLPALQLGRQRPFTGRLILARTPIDTRSTRPDGTSIAESLAVAFVEAQPEQIPIFIANSSGGTGFSQGDWGAGEPLTEELIANTNATITALELSRPPVVALQHGGALANQALAAEGQYDEAIYGEIDYLREKLTYGADVLVILTGLTEPRFRNNADAAAIQAANAAVGSQRFGTAFVDIADGDRFPLADPRHLDREGLSALGTEIFRAFAVAAANTR